MSSIPQLRPLQISEILDRTLRLYRSHFMLLISIPLLAAVPIVGLQVVSQFIWHSTRLVDLIQNSFVQVLVSSALVVMISQAYLGSPPSTGEAYRVAARRYGSAWGSNFLMGLAIVLPFVALACGATMLIVSGGIWIILLLALPYVAFLGTRWSLTLPGILLEHLDAMSGLRRSWSLTEGVFWKVFATSFLANLLILILATVPQLAIGYGLEMLISDLNILSVIETVLSQLSLILTTPISIGVTVVLYYDLRVRKEGFDLELQLNPEGVSPG